MRQALLFWSVTLIGFCNVCRGFAAPTKSLPASLPLLPDVQSVALEAQTDTCPAVPLEVQGCRVFDAISFRSCHTTFNFSLKSPTWGSVSNLELICVAKCCQFHSSVASNLSPKGENACCVTDTATSEIEGLR